MMKTFLIILVLTTFAGTATHAQKLLKEYYPNGQVKLEGIKLENNLEHGLWIKYYENGRIEMELSYNEGVKHGPFISYLENGNIESMGTYRNGKLDGIVVFFNELSQKIETVGKMKQGNQTGTWDLYDESGKYVKSMDF